MRGKKADPCILYERKIMSERNAIRSERMGCDRNNAKTQAAYKKFHTPPYYRKEKKNEQ